MSTVYLNEVATVLESGQRPAGGVSTTTGNIPSLGAEHLTKNGGFFLDEVKRIPTPFYEKMKKGKIRKNDILIVKDGATTGKTSFVGDDFPFKDSAINEHLFRLEIDEQLCDPKFVFWHLKSSFGQRQILSDFRGATVGGIGRTFLTKVCLPVKTIEEQRRIAAMLDKADAIHRKREQALALADDFLCAKFLDIFGDPVTNPKGWPKEELETIADMQVGHPFESKKYVESGVRLLRGANVSPIGLDWGDVCFWSEGELDKYKTFAVEPGDILVAMDRPWISSGFKIARATEPDLPALLVQRVARIRGKTKGTVNLWYYVLRHKGFEAYCTPTETTVPHISPMELKKFPMIVPPEKLIEEFQSYLSKFDKIKCMMEEQLSAAALCFDSLSQRAFRGEI